jgi:FkbM family methyltransferase
MKSLFKFIYRISQRLVSLTGWTFILTRARLRRDWVTTYIPSIDALMHLDMSESLDLCYASGSVDEVNIAFMKQTLNNNSVFVDVGANQGFYTLFVMKNFSGAHVVAIEPDPYSLSKLRKNLELNSLQHGNLKIVEKAAGVSESLVPLMINDAGNRAGSSVILDQRLYTGKPQNTTVEVKSLPLFEILLQNSIERVDCMKLDIEGYEFPVLQMFFEQAPSDLWPNYVLIEAFGHTMKNAGGSPINLLIKRGYELVDHESYNYIFSLPRV